MNRTDIDIQQIKEVTGAEIRWDKKYNGHNYGIIEFKFNQKQYRFIAECKKDVGMQTLFKLEALQKKHRNLMLIARRIIPKAKDALRQRGIAYIEANGNCYIKQGELLVYIDTNKPIEIPKIKGNRAFTKTGLKVLFHLLKNKELINLTQRELAEKTNVSLGTIPQVIKGLKETGYLISLRKNMYVWENREALLERWINDYATTLRPSLQKERYSLQGLWKNIHLKPTKTVWGGEPAADFLTNHLFPEKWILYTRETRLELIKNYRLKPNENGEVEVLEMFWEPVENLQTTPPLLVYADLLIEGGKRNHEVAKKLYNEHIWKNL